MRGRKSKPAALKQAQGNPGKRPLPKDPPAAASAAAKPVQAKPLAAPSYLSAKAKVIWKRLAPDLQRLKFLTSTDREAFARYCEWLVKWWDVERELRKPKTKLVVSTKSAHVEMDRMNKWFQTQVIIENRLEKLEDRFGLQPRARYEMLKHLATQPQLPLTPGGKDESEGEAPAKAPSSPIGVLGGTVH